MQDIDFSTCPEFVADCDFTAMDKTMMSFREGDRLVILHSEYEWWYGMNVITRAQGWLPPAYGHIDDSNVASVGGMSELQRSVSHLSDGKKIDEREKIMQELIVTEKGFISELKILIDVVITPIEVRDTNFKRTFLGDSSIALTFSLIRELYNACNTFLQSLRNIRLDADNRTSLVEASFVQFAPSLRIFGQYASENSNTLNALKKYTKILNIFLKEHPLPLGTEIEKYLVLPVQHYVNYFETFEKYVTLSYNDSKCDIQSLEESLDVLKAYIQDVDEEVKKEKSKLVLLAIQSQFIGIPTIYQDKRFFIMEGDVERIREKKDVANASSLTEYHIHLFNDAILISSKLKLGFYKLKKAFELKTLVVDIYETVEILNSFSIKVKRSENAVASDEDMFIFRCIGKMKNDEWVTALKTQIYNNLRDEQTANTRHRKRSSVVMYSKKATAAFNHSTTSVNLGSNSAQPALGVSSADLGPRSQCAVKFILSQLEEVKRLSIFDAVVIQPLIDASRGAILRAGNPNGDVNANSASRDTLFARDNSISSVRSVIGDISLRREEQAIMEALKFPDMQIFLRSCEGLTSALNEFVNSLETNAMSVGWADDQFTLGSMFSSQQATLLYQRYVTYASGKLAALRIIQDIHLKKFMEEVDQVCLTQTKRNARDTIIDILNTPQYFLEFLNKLLDITDKNSLDYSPIQVSINLLNDIILNIDVVVEEKMNFEKILSIQKSIVTLNLFPDLVIQNLVNNNRRFIMEDDLTKVCRKKNKEFRFWLFNDYLIYGASIPGGKYQLNRCIDLTTCAVEIDKSLGHNVKSFQLLGAEKSFVLICTTDAQLEKWVKGVSGAIENIKRSKGIETSASTQVNTVAAPIWVPDSMGSGCCVCNTSFSFTKRKHHCRKCGSLVCSDHSMNRLVLLNIHKSEKQRVCDNCYLSKPIPAKQECVPSLTAKDRVETKQLMRSQSAFIMPSSVSENSPSVTQRPHSEQPLLPPKKPPKPVAFNRKIGNEGEIVPPTATTATAEVVPPTLSTLQTSQQKSIPSTSSNSDIKVESSSQQEAGNIITHQESNSQINNLSTIHITNGVKNDESDSDIDTVDSADDLSLPPPTPQDSPTLELMQNSPVETSHNSIPPPPPPRRENLVSAADSVTHSRPPPPPPRRETVDESLPDKIFDTKAHHMPASTSTVATSSLDNGLAMQNTLLSIRQNSVHLKHVLPNVSQRETKMNDDNMLGMLANIISNRRNAIQDEDDLQSNDDSDEDDW